MTIKKILTLAAFAQLFTAAVAASATATRTFTSSEYYELEPTTIPAGKEDKFTNLKQLWCPMLFTNNGALEIAAQYEATVHLGRFVNGVNATTNIEGPGSLELSFHLTFENQFGSDFLADAKYLDFTINPANEKFQNDGCLSLYASDSLSVDSPNLFSNSRLAQMTSSDEGRFYFGEVLNFSEMHLLGSCSSDLLQFNGFYNHDYFNFNFGPTKGLVVDSRGVIANTGMFHIYGTEGSGEFQSAGEISNEGVFCLEHAFLNQTSVVSGKGCWSLSKSSFIVMSQEHVFEANQVVVLNDKSSFLVFVKMAAPGVIYDLYGVDSTHNFVLFGVPVSGCAYDPELGHLTIYENTESYTVFNIGKGYEKDKFVISKNEVGYFGANPPARDVPTICQCESFGQVA